MSPRISIRLLAAQSDERLLRLARDGHERAFEALVQRYRRPLLRYCRRLRLSDARAEDVLQQALLRAWLALSSGTEVNELKPWLYRIVHNTAVNAMRGAAEVPHGELTDAVQASVAQPGESELERKLAVRDALGHVAALPQMQRQAVFLTAVDGQSHDEVAGTLGITPGALRGLLYRARTTLRSAAAMLIPQPLLELAARSGDAAAPSAERALELTGAGAGAAGIASLLLKGGVAVVTAGALATGATVVASHEHHARHVVAGKSHAASASAQAPSSGRSSNGSSVLGSRASSRTRLVADSRHHGGHRSGLAVGRKRGHGTRHHDDLSPGAMLVPSTTDEGEPSSAGSSHDDLASGGDGVDSRHSERGSGRRARTDRGGRSDGGSRRGGGEQVAAAPAVERSSSGQSSGRGSGGDETSSSVIDPSAVTSERSGSSSSSGAGPGSGDDQAPRSGSGDDANTPPPE
jgi:RNA polymerase sigma factor (sigma-70 family)